MARPAPALPAAARGVLALLVAAALFAALVGMLVASAAPLRWVQAAVIGLTLTVMLGAIVATQGDQALLRRLSPVLAVAAAAAVWLATSQSGASALLPGMPMLAAALCLVQLSASRPAVWFSIGVAVLGLCGLALAAAVGRLPTAAERSVELLAWAGPLVLMLGAIWIGRLMARQQDQMLRHASSREQRFRALQRMAVDAAWETDGALRLRRLHWRKGPGRAVAVSEALGRRPWNLPALTLRSESEDLLRAQTEAHEPLVDLQVAWRCPDGRQRYFAVSGEPRFDASGRFRGYWGVARDVSGEALAREAQAAAERRYAHLFNGMPTPLMLLRQGRVVEANGAAAALLGYETVDAMRGHDLYFEHMDDEQRLQAQDRHDHLEAEPGSDWLPYEPQALQRVDGEPVHALASGSRAEHKGRAATLVLYVDETRQRGLESALRRTEALIGRILELGRDLLWLSEVDTGRCVMANDRFLAALNLPRDQVIGRTERQLGLWRHPGERDRVVRAAMQEENLQDLPLQLQLGRSGWVRLRVSAALVPGTRRAWLLMCARRAPASDSMDSVWGRGRAGFEAATEPAPLGERSAAMHTGAPPHGRPPGWRS